MKLAGGSDERTCLGPAPNPSLTLKWKEIGMQLKEIMTPGVEVIHPDTTIQQAAAKMRRLGIGPLPVCDGDRLIGMLTDRDITIRAVAEGYDPNTTTVREAMTP